MEIHGNRTFVNFVNMKISRLFIDFEAEVSTERQPVEPLKRMGIASRAAG